MEINSPCTHVHTQHHGYCLSKTQPSTCHKTRQHRMRDLSKALGNLPCLSYRDSQNTGVRKSLTGHLVPPLHGGDEKPTAQRDPGTRLRSHSKNWIEQEPELRPCDAWTCPLPTLPAATSLIPVSTELLPHAGTTHVPGTQQPAN